MEKKDLNEGEKAPLFKLDSFNAGMIDLANLIGDQRIVLVFSRYFGCPICQSDLKILIDRKSEIETKGAKILYITQSGEKIAKEFIQQKKIDFPVIPSSKDELYAEYGLGLMTPEAVKQIPLKLKDVQKYGFKHGEYEGWEKQGPGQFVIDEDGKVIHAQKGWLDIDSLIAVL
ncbi:MAG: peroxiredoxin-like family protein [Promethearchaeota archaeon]|jgi:peroxiredoxin